METEVSGAISEGCLYQVYAIAYVEPLGYFWGQSMSVGTGRLCLEMAQRRNTSVTMQKAHLELQQLLLTVGLRTLSGSVLFKILTHI